MFCGPGRRVETKAHSPTTEYRQTEQVSLSRGLGGSWAHSKQGRFGRSVALILTRSFFYEDDPGEQGLKNRPRWYSRPPMGSTSSFRIVDMDVGWHA